MISPDRKRFLKEEINQTIDIIQSFDERMESSDLDANKFSLDRVYDYLYAFGTEDMAGYYPEFGQPKTFLTVGASGDQLLNAIKLGATKIDVFDLNRLDKRQCELKVSSAKVLSAEELWKYFNSLDEDLFNRFVHKMKEEDRIYWESLYEFIGFRGLDKLYPYIKIPKELYFKINPYLERKGYEEFQERLENAEINYYDSDLYSLPELLKDNTYDAMNFSNIYEYLNYGRNTNYENALKYYQFIMEKMYPRLNQDGTIMAAYMYAFNKNAKKRFDELSIEYPRKLMYSEGITLNRLYLHLEGYTFQNYSYSLIQDLFENENIRKIPTSHVIFGRSVDMSHDMALCLKK